MKPILLAILLLCLGKYMNAQISPVGTYDNCSGAINLTVNATCVTGTDTYTTVGATASSPIISPSSDDDVWFKFTTLAGQTAARVQIPSYSGGMGNCFELWAGCSGSSPISTGCGSNFDVTGLSPNTVYYVRVYTNGTFATMTSFTICVVNTTPPPASPNDECTYATAIPVGANALSCTPSIIFNQNSLPSTNPPPCLSSSYRDIWLKFTPSATGPVNFVMQNYTSITGSSTPTYYAAIYSGTCGALTLINCSSIFVGNEITLSGSYTAGSTYYVRLLTDNANQGTFEVCIKSIQNTSTYPTSADSTCSKAISINSSADQSATYTNGSTSGIKAINQRDCYGYNFSNVLAWYSFTVPSNGNYYVNITDFIRLGLNANGSGYRILKRSSCYTTGTDTIITTPPAGTYDTVLCVDNTLYNNQSVTLTSGTQYYLTVMENTYNGGPVAYKLRVVGTTPPANDERANAIQLTQDVTCTAGNNPSTLRFSTLSTNPNPYSLSNNGTYTQDVWYKFTAATATVNIITTRVAVSTRIAIYNNDGSLKYDPTANSSSIAVNSLTIGGLYYIRILSTSATSVSSSADFNICVFGLPTEVLAGTVNACTNADATMVSTNSNSWLHFRKGGDLVVSVFDGPAVPGASFTPRGTISASYYTNTAGIRTNSGVAILDRNFELSDGGNNFTNSPVRVRFYFSIAEFNTLVQAAGNQGISAPYELRVYRIPGVACNTLPVTGGLYYNIAGYGYISKPLTPYVPEMYYVDMITPNFSGFFLQRVADNLLVPSICGSFSYQVNNNKVLLSFSTKTETNTNYFEVQRSDDGINFNSIATLNASNYSSGSNYQYLDGSVKPNQTYYYRLKQTDKDGKEQFVCKVLQASIGGKQVTFGNAYPNPISTIFTIDVQKAYTGRVDVQIINALGQVMQQQAFNLQATDTQLKIKLENHLTAGMYTIRLATNEGVQLQQVTKM